MDGGTTWNLNISSAVNGCLTMVDDESKITIDVLICGGGDHWDSSQRMGGSTIDNYLRGR
jgi:hypothetical protein